MRAAWRITQKDLLLRLRDRSALMVGFVIPLVLAFIFNAVFGGATGNGTLTTLGFADEDGGEVAAGLAEALSDLDDEGRIRVEEFADAAALRTRVEEGQPGAGIIVPAGFTAAVLAGEETAVRVIGNAESPTTASIARGVADGFAASVGDARRTVEVALATSGGPPDPGELERMAEASTSAGALVTVGPVEAADRLLDPSTFFAAGMAVFFLFFLVQFGVTGLIDEERDATLIRLQAAPIPRWSIVVGKSWTSLLLGVLALSVLALATSLLMGADWGDPVALGVLFVAVTVAASSLLGIVGAVARTAEGAGNLVAIIAVGLGMLGGTFFPVGANNRFLQVASQATPHFWFIRGVGDLQAGGSVAAIGPSLLALGAFAIVGGSVAAALLAWRYR